MLNKSQTIILMVFVAFLGGCSVIGMCMMAVTAYSIVVGEVEHVWLPLMLFAVGGATAIGALRFAMKRHEKDVTKRLNLDE